jgi:hypothetical protein
MSAMEATQGRRFLEASATGQGELGAGGGGCCGAQAAGAQGRRGAMPARSSMIMVMNASGS